MKSHLDKAYEAMQAAPDDDRAMLRFYERLADGEVFLALEREPTDDKIAPLIFHTEGQEFALIFDSAERLAEFAEREAPYACLSGRAICQMLGGHGIGLGVNLMVSSSAALLPAEVVDWLAQTLEEGPELLDAIPKEVHPPSGLPEILFDALDTKLAAMQGMARAGYLAKITFDNGATNHALAFLEALPGAESAIAGAISEALAFSGVGAGLLDVLFVEKDDPIFKALEAHAIRFDLPEPISAKSYPTGPGMDPQSPPKLR